MVAAAAVEQLRRRTQHGSQFAQSLDDWIATAAGDARQPRVSSRFGDEGWRACPSPSSPAWPTNSPDRPTTGADARVGAVRRGELRAFRGDLRGCRLRRLKRCGCSTGCSGLVGLTAMCSVGCDGRRLLGSCELEAFGSVLVVGRPAEAGGCATIVSEEDERWSTLDGEVFYSRGRAVRVVRGRAAPGLSPSRWVVRRGAERQTSAVAGRDGARRRPAGSLLVLASQCSGPQHTAASRATWPSAMAPASAALLAGGRDEVQDHGEAGSQRRCPDGVLDACWRNDPCRPVGQ